MSGSDVAVVVLRLGSHGLSADLTAALGTLRLDRPGTMVVVAENADDEPFVKTDDAFVDRTIRFGTNLGYAAAVNRAAATCGSPNTLIVLTDDVIVQQGSLEQLVDTINATGAAVVAPLNQTGDQTRAGGSWNRRWGWARHQVLKTQPTGSRLIDVDWADGACLAIDYPFFKSVGGFDERTFLYVEDCLICLHAALRNRRVVVTSSVSITQASGMRRRSGAHGYLLIRNEILAMRQMTRMWHGALLGGLLRTGLEATRSVGNAASAKHHRRQALGMALGLYDGAMGRYGPPPEQLARWASIPNIEHGNTQPPYPQYSDSTSPSNGSTGPDR